MGKLETAITGWESNLLDLSRSNRMINYPLTPGKRGSRQTLRLDQPGYAELYDLLVRQGKSLPVQQPPVEKFDLRAEAVMRLFERMGSPVVPMEGVVRPAGSFTEYRKVLKNMRAKMKLAREEQGIGILYMAVGFLEWQPFSGPKDRIFSPLLLVPVRLTLKNIRAPFVLETHDEDVVVNPALAQLFSTEYNLTLPELADQDAPVDEYLDQVELLAKQHSWAVRRECHLALMSFQKISMYHDLKRNHERIAQNPVLRAIAGEEPYPLDPAVMDSIRLDAIPPGDSHLVVNADSSQHYAVELSRRGVSFCLQGPPGGGKSQTITNIIAQALADGKKVLFVAEKMAALDVVHRRLRDVGLGEFTLALHSHRANRKSILAEISQPLQLEKQELDHQAMATLDALEDLCRRLNVYPSLLHRRREPLGESLYGVLGELATLTGLPLVSAPLQGVEEVTRSALNAEVARLSQLARAHRRYQTLPDNPYEGLQGSWTTFMTRAQLKNELIGAIADAQGLQPVIARLMADGLLQEGDELTSITALQEVCAAAQQGPVSDALFTGAARIAALADKARHALGRIDDARRIAETVFLPGAQLTDAADCLTRMTALESDVKAVLTGSAWQSRLDAHATHYGQLEQSIRRHTDIAGRALTLMGCTARSGAEADWALDALAAMLATPNATTLPEADVSRLLQQIRSVRESAGSLLERQWQLLGRNWADSVLTLDAAGMLRRFAECSLVDRINPFGHYAKELSRLRNHFTGRTFPDERGYTTFLNSLAAWQTERQEWSRKAYAITNALGLRAMGPDADWGSLEEQLTALYTLTSLADTPGHARLLAEALQKPEIRISAESLRTWTLRYASYDKSLRGASYGGNVLTDDVTVTLQNLLTAAEDLKALRDLQDELRPACHPGVAWTAMLRGLRALDEQQRYTALLDSAIAEMSPLLPGEALSARSDLAALHAAASRVLQAQECGACLPEGVVRSLLTGARALPDLTGTADLSRATARLARFAAGFSDDASPLAMPFAAMCARLQRCLDEPDALDLWQEWRDASAGMSGTLFAPFVDAARAAELPADQWADAARRCFLFLWVEHVLGEEHLLSLFHAHVHEENISQFATLDQQQLLIARSRIRKQLIDVLPDEKHRAFAATDELALLMRETNRRSGHMPLRKLFSRIPNLLLTLKPCLMMSPLSVASYLEDSAMTFDLVIFDEASQIMPENAIGAIMRGKQVIVTGDTKQMPPTDFFTVSVGGHDYDTDEEEEAPVDEAPTEESILEQCATVLPSCPLLWHYRSRHESLIAFSNREIYAGRLVTSPGSIDKQAHLGVELVYVPDGVFHKRRNRPEALRCIDLIEDHILNRSHRSLGVVAFSRTQQSAIEEELHRFRIAHPEYDEFFDETRDEPFFIKNLENVQGDERDTMIFSVGYAKREGGKPMSLNLGPLSASGGERRLNVAITRARCNIKLVTSVLARDIDLSRTGAEGTRLLRAYIDYAEKGFSAIAADDAVQTRSAPKTDAFVAHLADVLTDAGFRVERSVGCSDCRIDLAVCHPTVEGRYVLGILTDGVTYAAQRTCRDRDHLQGSVLNRMGWQLYRVWSADWLQRPEGVERELIAAVQAAIDAPAPAPEALADQPVRVWSHPAARPEQAAFAFADYQVTLLPSGQDLPVNELELRVVDAEQPVHRDEICRRLAPALGHDRVDPGLRRTVGVAIDYLALDELTEADGFLSRRGFTLTQPRRAGKRTIDMISPDELRLAIRTVAEHSIRADREAIIARVAELLGYERRGPRIQRALESAFDALVSEDVLRIADGKVEMPVGIAVPEAPAALPAPDAPPALPAADAPIALPAPLPADPEVTDND